MNLEQGYADFQPIGIKITYTLVDLSKKQVISTISCDDEVKITIIIDLHLNQVYKNGSFDEILAVLPSRDEESYINEINDWAKIFIENKITDPKKYFEQFM
ncbi:hypothetical protein ACFPYN_17395 [Paenisporosarcina macmurdoensis]|uniref:Uncharacterized protein n=1 Tax=Paenisporosarcina macmurdoensis TaxID=212659 RepID=A0ABW1LDA8_9BACL